MTEINVINKKYSRYTQGGESVVSVDNKVKWWERAELLPDTDDLLVEIIPRFHKRPDRMAYELYGKSELAWVILQFNTILDINTEFTTGKLIKTPHPNRLIFDILNKPLGGTKE